MAIIYNPIVLPVSVRNVPRHNSRGEELPEESLSSKRVIGGRSNQLIRILLYVRNKMGENQTITGGECFTK